MALLSLVVPCLVASVPDASLEAKTTTTVTTTTTASHAEAWVGDFQLRVEFVAGLERSNKVEKGWVHPESIRLHVMKLFRKNVGVFSFAQVGQGQSELLAGFVLRPFAGIVCDDPVCDAVESIAQDLILELELGIGLGAAGVPIVGGSLRFELNQKMVFQTFGFYHYVTGVDQRAVWRGTTPLSIDGVIETWGGIFGHVAGRENLFDSFEGGPLFGVRLPPTAMISVGWPFRRHERRSEVRLRLWVELTF